MNPLAKKSLRIVLWYVSTLWLVGGCSWFGDDNLVQDKGPRLADVIDELPGLELPEAGVYEPTREEVMAAYERVYGMMPNVGENLAVGKRLADLQMDVAEDKDIQGEFDPYAQAVELYERLLADSHGAGQDQIMYQLARAYDLQGNREKTIEYLDRMIAESPDSIHAVEAHFRRAEIAFSEADYVRAGTEYGHVVAAGEDTPYWQNANYMRGWSQFKESDLDGSLESFFAVIGSLLPEDQADPKALAATDRELLDDSFRVITLALGYLDGAETLAARMETLNQPAWQFLAYERLAQDHLAKERYLDSVATWQTFVDRNTLDLRAPNAHIGMIDTLVAADFPSQVQPKKEEFIKRYGVHGDFWNVHTAQDREAYLPTLKKYLGETAKLAHSKAQKLDKGSNKRVGAFMQAANWYEEVVTTFPEDPAIAEHLFLLGEVYTEADEPTKAVASYQKVLREFPGDTNAPEAGYAAILGLAQLAEKAPNAELELLQRLKVDAQIEFALLFTGDERAPAVQTDAANSLFELQQYKESVELASNALQTWPDLAPPLARTALLIVGHGGFEQGQYAAAEGAYQQLLRGVRLADDEQTKVRDRLLASIYRQAEASEAAQDPDGAVGHYLRMANIDANAELTSQGHFDAVAVLEEAGRVDQAAQLLRDYRTRYPDKARGADVDLRLASMYESTQSWRDAAAEYINLSASSPSADVRRQSLYRGAEIYLEQNDKVGAAKYFAQYVEQYPKADELTLESLHTLDQLANEAGDGTQRRKWLTKKIDLHRAMGRKATPRAAYLAAEAQMVFADDERREYLAIRLTNPLPKSLKAKQKALKRTVAAYEKGADYKVAEFASASTFRIAELYSQLSKAIMTSDRPSNLSELEMEQYDILLEEQAYPFEEQAIGLHEINMRRSWEGVYDDWVEKSFVALRSLMPARFDKPERQVAYVDRIH